MIRSKNLLSECFAVELPEETKTYKPVSNEEVVTKIVGYILDEGFIIEDIDVNLGSKNQVMFGNITVKSKDEHYAMNVGFVNSYNKERAFGIAIGAKVYMCNNLDFSDAKASQKHTGEIQGDIDSIIYETIKLLPIEYNRIMKEYELLKSTPVDKATIGEILGRLFFEEDIMRSEQLNIVKNVMKEPNNLNGLGTDTLYNVLMAITHAYKTEKPGTVIDRLIKSRKLILGYAETPTEETEKHVVSDKNMDIINHVLNGGNLNEE